MPARGGRRSAHRRVAIRGRTARGSRWDPRTCLGNDSESRHPVRKVRTVQYPYKSFPPAVRIPREAVQKFKQGALGRDTRLAHPRPTPCHGTPAATSWLCLQRLLWELLATPTHGASWLVSQCLGEPSHCCFAASAEPRPRAGAPARDARRGRCVLPGPGRSGFHVGGECLLQRTGADGRCLIPRSRLAPPPPRLHSSRPLAACLHPISDQVPHSLAAVRPSPPYVSDFPVPTP